MNHLFRHLYEYLYKKNIDISFNNQIEYDSSIVFKTIPRIETILCLTSSYNKKTKTTRSERRKTPSNASNHHIQQPTSSSKTINYHKTKHPTRTSSGSNVRAIEPETPSFSERAVCLATSRAIKSSWLVLLYHMHALANAHECPARDGCCRLLESGGWTPEIVWMTAGEFLVPIRLFLVFRVVEM